MNTFLLIMADATTGVANTGSDTIAILGLVANYIIAIGVVFAALSFNSSQRANHLQTIMRCTNEFRVIVRKIQEVNCKNPLNNAGASGAGSALSPNSYNPAIIKKDLLGLFNEQLFYIKKGYIPKEICLEWMNTIYINLKNQDANNLLNFVPNDWVHFERVNIFMKYVEAGNISIQQLNDIYAKYYRWPF